MKRSRNRIVFVLICLSALILASCTARNRPAEERPVPEAAPADPEDRGEIPASKTEEDPAPAEEPEMTAPWTESKIPLRFREDGEFHILVFSDIHGSGTKISDLAKTNLALLVEREQPDLILLDGDNTWGIGDEKTLRSCVGDLSEVFEEKGIPWAHVYGNHDAEGNNLKKEKQQQIYESFPHCVSQAGDPSLPGVGNYVLPVYASDGSGPRFLIWALDSGQYISAEERADLRPVGGIFPGFANSEYDFIRPSQIAWYRETSAVIEQFCGGKVPGLMAFHIPLQETYAAWVNRNSLEHTGEKREAVCASEINSGLFAALYERGDVKAVVNGHDHVNDYMVKYGGIRLCYVSTVSETGYCDMDMLGARVFVIREDDPAEIETYMSYVDERRMADVKAYADALPIPAGVVLDFESYEPEIEACGWDNNYSEEAEVGNITAEIAEGRGKDGSKALGVGRLNFGESTYQNNAEVKIPLSSETAGLLGENRYLRVWMDLGGDGTPIDFRKACFGLIVNGEEFSPYRTDDLDAPSPFWVLPEGETAWREMSHGNDGCFGVQQNSSVKGMKGWFAFPVENMLKRGSLEKLRKTDCITGVYFYYCYNSEEMAGHPVWLDDITLTGDYKVFD